MLLIAAFAFGIVFAFFVALRGQRGRPGALAGIIAGVPLSVPAGILAGMHLWERLESLWGLPSVFDLMLGPFCGSFLATYGISILARELGAQIAEKKIQATGAAAASKRVSAATLLVALVVSIAVANSVASYVTLTFGDDLRFWMVYWAGPSIGIAIMNTMFLIFRVVTLGFCVFIACLISGLNRRSAIVIATVVPLTLGTQTLIQRALTSTTGVVVSSQLAIAVTMLVVTGCALLCYSRGSVSRAVGRITSWESTSFFFLLAIALLELHCILRAFESGWILVTALVILGEFATNAKSRERSRHSTYR
jgi:hypothetical protein